LGQNRRVQQHSPNFQTVWVPEYCREYCVNRIEDKNKKWSSEEFIHIASEHSRREDEQARNAYGVLISDTDAFATTVWHKRYMGFYSPEVQKIANRRKVDLYILTGDEIPFEQDGTRDGENIRNEMHKWFIDELERTGRKHILVNGSHEERMDQAIKSIKEILS
jgi:nicotinamide riboside kinase